MRMPTSTANWSGRNSVASSVTTMIAASPRAPRQIRPISLWSFMPIAMTISMPESAARGT